MKNSDEKKNVMGCMIRDKKFAFKRKKSFRNIGIFLIVAVLLTFSMPIYGEEARENTPKEEVVYVNMTADGTVKNMNVVNIFELAQETQVLDYGDYDSIKVLNSTKKAANKLGMVTLTAPKGRLYYEGSLKGKELPWIVKVRYSLDGKDTTPDKLVGKSGAMTITVNISKNEAVEGTFFEDYALQTNILLDTYKAKNIKADHMTVANVGAKKQLTYTALPGKGANFTVEADVDDFQMDGMTVNAVPLNLDIKVDDRELLDKIDELKGATGELSHGSAELSDGMKTFKTQGTDKIYTGVNRMEEALQQLDSHSKALSGGSEEFREALEEVNRRLEDFKGGTENLTGLKDGSKEIAQGIEFLVNGMTQLEQGVNYQAYKNLLMERGLDLDELQRGNQVAASKVDELVASLNSLADQMEALGLKDKAAELRVQINGISELKTLAEGNNAGIKGTEIYLDGVNDKLKVLVGGGTQLQGSYKQFDEKISELVDSLSEISVKMSLLAQGINRLVLEYEKLDGGVEAYTDGVSKIAYNYGEMAAGVSDLNNSAQKLVEGSEALKEGNSKLDREADKMKTEAKNKIDNLMGNVNGSKKPVQSFVSSKNTNVNSLQFAMKTDSVEKPVEKKPEAKEKEKETFFKKLFKLFRD